MMVVVVEPLFQRGILIFVAATAWRRISKTALGELSTLLARLQRNVSRHVCFQKKYDC